MGELNITTCSLLATYISISIIHSLVACSSPLSVLCVCQGEDIDIVGNLARVYKLVYYCTVMIVGIYQFNEKVYIGMLLWLTSIIL